VTTDVERAGSPPSPGRFVVPPYPYDRLAELAALASRHPGGAVDLSIGTPGDPPPTALTAALASSPAVRGYPASLGSATYRQAAARWVRRRFGVEVDVDAVAACVGTKELVATVPWLLGLTRPERRVVLYPSVAYPTYAMGALLAGCRPVPVALDEGGRLALDSLDPAVVDQALVLWVNSPANPTGRLTDLDHVAQWGRRHQVPVFSDECYAEFTWDGPPRTILASGLQGVVAVHSISKRSNAAGVRAGFYAGDGALVRELAELRRHLGMMVPGPVQAAAAAAWDDDGHVEEQRARYRRRLQVLSSALVEAGVAADVPAGGFYLWAAADRTPAAGVASGEPAGAGWALARALAANAGVVSSPGDLYGEEPANHVRLAVVAGDDRIAAVADRLRRTGADALARSIDQFAAQAPTVAAG